MFDKGQKQSSTLSCDSSYFVGSGVWTPPDPIQFKCCIHILEILECLEIHMSGSRACRDSPHGQIENVSFEGREK